MYRSAAATEIMLVNNLDFNVLLSLFIELTWVHSTEFEKIEI